MWRYVMISGVLIIALLPAILGSQLAAPADAQGGSGFELIQSTTASSSLAGADGYSLSASAGLPEAGDSSGGGYTLSGGFWGGPFTNPWHIIYLPIMLR